MPTRVSEEKRARDEEAAQQRMEQNGRSILTMWIVGHMIQQHRCDFHLAKECYPIKAVFSTFTNLAESGIEFDEFDLQFLRDFEEGFKREYIKNNVQFQEGVNCRELWKRFLEAFWTSDGFARFEGKFVAKIVLPFFKKPDGAMLTISDNLFLLDKLTKFLKNLSMGPTLPQQMSTFYASSGLTNREKTELLCSEKKQSCLKHQLKITSAKLTRANDQLKEQTMRGDFLQSLLEREQSHLRKILEQIASLESELDAYKKALKKYRDARPAECIICQSLYTTQTSMKKTSCCGTIICDQCYDQLKMHTQQDNPICPQCRKKTRQDKTLVPIIDCDPGAPRIDVRNVETTFDLDVSHQSAIDGPEIGSIPKPLRPPSIYAQLMDSQARAVGGGGAEMSKSLQKLDQPVARADS